MELDWNKRSQINSAIASMHEEGDVTSFEINKNKRIEFPRGFLRTFNFYREIFSFLETSELKEKVVQHMMHRDTLHWLWLKTDIIADARKMVIKFQLINLASILEGTVKFLTPEMAEKKYNVYDRIDRLQNEGLISNGQDLKKLWQARRSIHLHLEVQDDPIDFNDINYKAWHSALSIMISDLKKMK
jgi:hypothetical protein